MLNRSKSCLLIPAVAFMLLVPFVPGCGDSGEVASTDGGIATDSGNPKDGSNPADNADPDSASPTDAADADGALDALDATIPTVIATVPANGAIHVPINGSVIATFSEAMDPSTLTTTTFTVIPGGGATALPGTVGYATERFVRLPEVPRPGPEDIGDQVGPR